MAGSIRGVVIGVSILLTLAAPAQGQWRLRYAGSPYTPVYRTAYYYPAVAWAPVYCVPAMPVHPYIVVPPPPPPPAFAQPWPVPPSATTSEPPLSGPEQRAPKVLESRYAGAVAPAAANPAPGGKELIRVGFWNVSGRDVALTVNGKMHVVPRDRAITLALERQFTWKVDRAAERSEDVPQSHNSHEIVLRPAKAVSY